MANPESDRLLEAIETVASGGLLLFATRGIALALGFLTQLAMARLLLPSQYGDVILAIAVASMAELLAKLGLDDGMSRKIPEYEDHPGRTRGVLRAGVGIGLLSSLLISALLFVAAPFLAELVSNSDSMTLLIRIAALGIPFSVIGGVFISAARGARSARPHAYVNQIVRPVSRFMLIALLVYVGFDAVGAIVGQTLAGILTGIAAIIIAVRVLPSWDASPVQMYHDVLVFSLPLIVMQGMNFLISNTDTLMLGYFLNSTAVGAYNLAFQLRNLSNVLLVTGGFLIPPVLTRLQAENRPDEMNNMYSLVTKYIFILTIPILYLFFFFPDFMISLLFGSGYEQGATALQVLIIGAAISVVVGVSGSACIGLGANKTVMYTTTSAAIINAILNYTLIPRFGIVGAALASTISIIFQELGNVVALYHYFNMTPARAVVLPIALGATIMGYGSTLLAQLELPVVITVPIWVISYLIFVYFIGVTRRDVRIVNALVKKFIA